MRRRTWRRSWPASATWAGGRLPHHLAEEPRGGVQARWEIEGLAPGFRLAALTLAARGQFPAAEFGRAVAELIRHGFVTLKRITLALGDLAAAGAHAEVWRALAVALPPLLPGPGERPRAGLGELLGVAVRAAVLAGGKGEILGLAEMAARKGSSLVLHEAGRLHEAISS
ncbi:hypothetical protein AB0J35_48670 [Nonomuraea angiospora]|uniref:hypothetical protein n=1 Tax=Nonomuraea angiospora TaxID=46172 RepID=UPI003431B4EE